MLQKTEGIVLHSLKYGDNGLIVKIFTREFGLKSFMVKGFRSRKSSLKASLFIPLTIITMDIDEKKTASAFNSIKEAQCLSPMHHIQSNFSKQATALFIAEVLYKTIADEAAHEDLYEFIESTLKYLNDTPSLPSLFPHFFLVRYSRYLGLYPNENGDSELYFDMRDGVFTSTRNLHSDFFMEEESTALKALLNSDATQIGELKWSNSLRAGLLQGLLNYYRIHLLNFREIRSHLVLSEVLRG